MPSHPPQRKYVALLSVIAGAILIIGGKFKPSPAPEVTIPQTEMLRLQLAAQRRNLEDLTSYFARVAKDVLPTVKWVRGLEASAVVWSGDGTLVSRGPSAPVTVELTTGPHRLTADVVSIHYPVSSMRLPAGVEYPPAFRAAARSLPQGSWVLQVAARRDGGHLYAPGTLQGVLAVECGDFTANIVETNLPLDETTAGGGVFDLQGNLLGVVVRCGDRFEALTPEAIDRVLDEARGLRGRLLRYYGLRLEPLTEEMREYFGAELGLLATEVWTNWPGDVAGLLPGDIIQALDGAEVSTLDDLSRLVLPVAYPTYELTVLRSGKIVRLTLPASQGGFPAASRTETPGIVLRPRTSGYRIEDVIPGSPADRAGLKPGDRLLTVGGRRPRNLAAAHRALAATDGRPVWLAVERGPRKFGVFLRP